MFQGTLHLLHRPAGLHNPSSKAGLSLLLHSLAGSGLLAGLYRYVPDQSGTGVASETKVGTVAGDWEWKIKQRIVYCWNCTDPSQITCVDEAKFAECFTCDLHCIHILEWQDKREFDHLQSPAEVGCLSAVRLYAPGRFCCPHAGPCLAACPARTEKKRGSPVCHTKSTLSHS